MPVQSSNAIRAVSAGDARLGESSSYSRGKRRLYNDDIFYDYHEGTLNGAPVCERSCRVVSPRDASKEQCDKFIKNLSTHVDTWSKLQHPAIAKFEGIFPAGPNGYSPSLLFENFDNGFLPEYLSTNPNCNRLRVLYGVAAGLQYLHTMSPPILHRNVRGQNIVVNDEGEGCLTNIGISFIHHPDTIKRDPFFLSIAWMAPELVRPSAEGVPTEFTLASDVYALGVTALEIFSRRFKPHDGAYYVLSARTQNTYKLPKCPNIDHFPRGIWTLIESCLAYEPHRRPSIGQVANTIEEILLDGKRD